MKKTSKAKKLALARSRGFLAVASDGPVGKVEAPLLPPDGDAPDFLVLRTRSIFLSRRPVVSVALVDDVDSARGLVFLRGRTKSIRRLPEHLPLAL